MVTRVDINHKVTFTLEWQNLTLGRKRKFNLLSATKKNSSIPRVPFSIKKRVIKNEAHFCFRITKMTSRAKGARDQKALKGLLGTRKFSTKT